MRVLGIDPGYHRCGYALLDAAAGAAADAAAVIASGVIVVPAGEPPARRLHALAGQLDELLATLAPDSVAVEEVFFSNNAKTAIGVAQARGVVLQRCAASGVEVAEYTPTMVKSRVTGNGRAGKEQVAYMIRAAFSLPPQSRLDDELDAMAVALCHLRETAAPAELKAGHRRDG